MSSDGILKDEHSITVINIRRQPTLVLMASLLEMGSRFAMLKATPLFSKGMVLPGLFLPLVLKESTLASCKSIVTGSTIETPRCILIVLFCTQVLQYAYIAALKPLLSMSHIYSFTIWYPIYTML